MLTAASMSAVDGQNGPYADIADTLLNILMACIGNGGTKSSKLDFKHVHIAGGL